MVYFRWVGAGLAACPGWWCLVAVASPDDDGHLLAEEEIKVLLAGGRLLRVTEQCPDHLHHPRDEGLCQDAELLAEGGVTDRGTVCRPGMWLVCGRRRRSLTG